jgi:hypothetical protein
MEPAKIFVNGKQIRYVISQMKEVVLQHGENLVSDPEILLAIIKNPSVCRYDSNQLVNCGVLKPDVLASFGIVAKVVEEVPVKVEAPKVPKVEKPSFGSMTMAELRDYAESMNVVIRKNWDKDKIVDVLSSKVKDL